MYQQQFQAFLNKCDQREKMYCEFAKLSGLFDTCETVVSFGCGTGVVDRELGKYMPNMKSYQLVDPMCEVVDLDAGFTFHKVTYEEFIQKNACKFDIIVHCHDLYYLDDKKKALFECLERLNGYMIVVLEDDDGIASIRQKFCPTKYFFPSTWMFNLLDDGPTLKEHLVEVVHIDGRIDIDGPSEDLLNFFLLGKTELAAELKVYLLDKYANNIMPQTSKLFLFRK
jgi:SAM-dependent methyltransferase